MAELKGTLLTPETRRRSEPTIDIGMVALKWSLAPEASDISADGGVLYESVINRDSGIIYSLIGRVVKADGRVTLQLEATDGSGGRVTVPESRLKEALAAEGGAWSSVNRVE